MANNISKKVQEILKTATPRQKALMMCRRGEEMSLKGKPILTDDEAQAIRYSLTDPDEAREYNRYLDYYNTFLDMTPLVGLCEAMYKGEANEMIGYLREYETYIEEENQLNIIYEQIRQTGNDEAIAAFDEALKLLTFSKVKLKRDKLGYVYFDYTTCYENLLTHAGYLGESLIALKSIIVAIEEWTKAHRCKSFIPSPMRKSIAFAKEHDYVSDVAPRYSRKRIQEKMKNGGKVSQEEARWAFFPSYDEVEPREEYLDMWRRKLADTEKTWKQ